MASIYTVWTTKGKAMAAEQLGPNNPITFTRVAASSKDYSSTDPTVLAALTKLDSEQQKGYIAYSNIINSNTLHMELLFKNSDATKNYNLYAVGLYATGSDKQEYLYSVTVLQNPQVINTDAAGSTFGLSLNTVVGDAATAKVTITDAGAITQAILDAELAHKVTDNLNDSIQVNGKTITPADDSKVVHNSGNEDIGGQKTFDIAPIDKTTGNPYITKSNVPKVDLSNYATHQQLATKADDSKVIHHAISKPVTDMNDEISDGLFYNTSLETSHSPFSSYYFYYQVFAEASGSIRQVAYADYDAFNPTTRSSANGGSTWTKWSFEPIVDNKGVMTYGSSNATIKIADDSKVIHRDPDSGNTSEDVNFTGKAQKDHKDLLTADQLPPDLARTGQASTFTAAQTFSIAPTITDASRDKGDNQAATMADLKSLENSAWRVLDQSNAPSNIFFRGQVLYKIDDAKKIIYFTTNGQINGCYSNSNLINFKGIVNNLLSGHGRLTSVSYERAISVSDISTTSTYVQNSGGLSTADHLASYGDPGQNYAYVIYDSLR